MIRAKCQNYGIFLPQYEPANRHVFERIQLRTLSCQTIYVYTYAYMCISSSEAIIMI